MYSIGKIRTGGLVLSIEMLPADMFLIRLPFPYFVLEPSSIKPCLSRASHHSFYTDSHLTSSERSFTASRVFSQRQEYNSQGSESESRVLSTEFTRSSELLHESCTSRPAGEPIYTSKSLRGFNPNNWQISWKQLVCVRHYFPSVFTISFFDMTT